MNSAVVSDPKKVNLTQFSQPTEIRDSSGCIVGFFTPASSSNLGDYFTKEELDAAAAEPGGKTLEEIWKTLGAKRTIQSFGNREPSASLRRSGLRRKIA